MDSSHHCQGEQRYYIEIRQYLTRDAALTAANALVGSRLDYCNSLFRGLSVAVYSPQTQKCKNCLRSARKVPRRCQLWLCANKLKLNADKTDFILFGAKSQQEKFNPFFPVNILGESLIPSDAVKNLGVWFFLHQTC